MAATRKTPKPKDPFASLKILPPFGVALPKPTDADLDKAEKTLGVKLPEAYREFAKRFGLGEHAQYFRIYVPFKSPKYKGSDLAQQALRIREALSDMAEKKKDKAFYRRMIPFADTIGGDLFAFDPEAAQGKQGEDTADYPVFAMIKGRDGIKALSPDFTTFVSDVVYGKGLGKVLKSKDDSPVIREFLPYGNKVRGL